MTTNILRAYIQVMNLKLYNYFRSSASYRARLALHFKGLPFDYVPVHLIKNSGEQHSSEYKKLNSLSQVPTLIHQTKDGEKAISQSVAIIEYLEEVFPEWPLFPKNAFLKSKMREFAETVNSLAQPMANLGTLQYLEKNLQITDQNKSAWINNWSHKALEHLEELSQKFHGKFSFGDEFTYADCFLIPQLFTARRFKVDLSTYPTLIQVDQHVQTLDFAMKAHPQNQIDSE